MSVNRRLLRGAFILAGGGLLARVLGVPHRLVVYWLLGAEGAGLYELPGPLLALLLNLCAEGVCAAATQLVAEAQAIGRPGEARRVLRVSLASVTGVGALLAAALWWAAPWLAAAQDPRALPSYRAAAPALVLVPGYAAYRAYFAGLQAMAPNAAALIVEQLVRLAAVMALVPWSLREGLGAAAAAAALGTPLAAAAGWLYLHRVDRVRLRWRVGGQGQGPPIAPGPSAGRIALRLARIALPLSLAGATLPLIFLVDAALVPGRLRALGYAPAEATRLYGQLAAIALPLVQAPTVLGAAIGASALPAIAEARARGDRGQAVAAIHTVLRMTFQFSLPAAAVLFALGTPLVHILFADPRAGALVQALAPAAVLFSLQHTTAVVLHALGQPHLAARHLLAAVACKLLALAALGSAPVSPRLLVSLPTLLGFALAAWLNVSRIAAAVGSAPPLWATLGRPLLASLSTALVAARAWAWAEAAGWAAWPAAGVVGAALAGSAAYLLALVALGGLYRSDVESIPRIGPYLADVLGGLHLVRRTPPA